MSIWIVNLSGEKLTEGAFAIRAPVNIFEVQDLIRKGIENRTGEKKKTNGMERVFHFLTIEHLGSHGLPLDLNV